MNERPIFFMRPYIYLENGCAALASLPHDMFPSLQGGERASNVWQSTQSVPRSHYHICDMTSVRPHRLTGGGRGDYAVRSAKVRRSLRDGQALFFVQYGIDVLRSVNQFPADPVISHKVFNRIDVAIEHSVKNWCL